MTTITASSTKGINQILAKIWAGVKRIPPVFPIFLLIFIVLGFLNPKGYQTMNGIMTFFRPAAPLAVLAIGEMLVLAMGGFDLSIGAIVTMVVLASSKLLANDPEKALPAILIMIGIGVLIGLFNGLVVSFLKVPSFITTLGMMLLIRGATLYYIGCAPQGYLTDNWRQFGRNYIQDVPFFVKIPYALIILIVLGLIIYILFHRTNYGKQVLAIGDNMRAAQLSGVRVKLIRVVTHVMCSVLAVLAGILVGGFGGVNVTIGEGMEMQAIAACVIGGVLLGGGKGSVLNVVFGAFTLQAIVNLLNQLGLPKPYTDVIQGSIIIFVVAYAALSSRNKR
jgi:ribose transport system permease protein